MTNSRDRLDIQLMSTKQLASDYWFPTTTTTTTRAKIPAETTLTNGALNLRVACVSVRADAHWSVLDDATNGVGSADVRSVGARVLAVALDASLVLRAVGVGFAFDALRHRLDLTPDERIAREPWRARADRLVAHHLTLGVDSARAGARVATFLRNAGERVGAVRVGRTFRPTRRVRVADQSRQADALADVVVVSTLGVGAARVRIANVEPVDFDGLGDDRDGGARRERVAFVSLPADADGHVIGHAAVGVRAARVHARTLAPVAHAALVLRAVGVQHALGSARDERVADVARRAHASHGSALFATVGVQAASVGRAAGLGWFFHYRFDCSNVRQLVMHISQHTLT